MRLDGWTIVLQTINFAILVWLLHRFLYRPVLAMIDARKAEIRRQFDAASATDEKARQELAAITAERAGIAAEREAVLRTAAGQAQAMAAARRAQGEGEAQALLDSGRRTLASERAQALDEARRLALDLGLDVARRLLAEIPLRYRADAWLERIEQHWAAMPSAERDPLVRELADGTPLAVVTACALPATTTQQWRERLQRSLGVAGGMSFAMNFAVDAALIAGAELHFPTAILRFSWQHGLLAARAEAGSHDRPG